MRWSYVSAIAALLFVHVVDPIAAKGSGVAHFASAASLQQYASIGGHMRLTIQEDDDSEVGDQDHDGHVIKEAGESEEDKKKRKLKRCSGFMPAAHCPRICKSSRTEDGCEDCSTCNNHKFMPQTQCLRTNTCTKYRFMPIAKCAADKKNDGYKTLAPSGYPTPAPSTYPTPEPSHPSSAPTTKAPTPAPTPAPSHPSVVPATPAPSKPSANGGTGNNGGNNNGGTNGGTGTNNGGNNNNGGKNGGTTGTNGKDGTTGTNTNGANNNNGGTGTANNSSGSSSSSISGGAIAGIVIGCAACAGAVGFFIWKKKKDQSREQEIFGDAHQDAESGGGDYAAM
ncbi:hypothetical protein, variant [Saprolegnia diclina VS20]|uniref:TNFR-Cys domain-containing protein n=1 Tax=Saprolegnia diclina (strain VS20) TaxID=1156394 RepID=T0Q2K1_SAPDV|nr:hypothetical protein, variant [Saprolegnia diclina VS20]EQC32059.1 hypothetical protein, variant [Saprolegnia diclina VS20]|eukprot:XP_008614461.1 hypothetical protein, variant [Saprolegnia diclina VS20]